MQLIIDIDCDYFEYIKEFVKKVDTDCEPWAAIANGTPLPEGHGNLIDSNYLLDILKCDEYETCSWRNCSECNREKCIKERTIANAPVIIEADKGGKADED